MNWNEGRSWLQACRDDSFAGCRGGAFVKDGDWERVLLTLMPATFSLEFVRAMESNSA